MRRVVITGAGVVSSLGDTPAALHAALCEGRSGISPVKLFDTTGLGCPLGGEVSDFDAQKYLGRRNLRPLDRTSRLVASAAQLALDASGWTPEMRAGCELGLVLGTMFCSVRTIAEFDRRALEAGPGYASPMDFANTVINAAAGQAAIMHGLRGVNTTVSTGITSGLQAIAHASEQIRAGRADFLLAGGAEELCFESFYGFERAGLLCRSAEHDCHHPVPFDARRNGLTLGEGAALLMLEEEQSALARGARVLAEVRGAGAGYDCSRGRDEAKAVKAAAHSMHFALYDAGMLPYEVESMSASANGSPLGDRVEARAVAQVFGDHARRMPVTAVKAMLGETLGASGALQTVDALETLRDCQLPGIPGLEETEEDFPFAPPVAGGQGIDCVNVLVNSVGLDGHSCSLVVARFDE
ncbi:MAG TPA: beta-ketoacyl-[acyl-carrier-protein] synthase family protein [Pyrinomonadaceae bacterium]|jgi:3-oxoacyl-[acyl-carrier-protein] synthase II|nr:beta-ketoacyl-[acyl-carrier-protein] synthase family protein [Pyrinomonadaceae bacterium]